MNFVRVFLLLIGLIIPLHHVAATETSQPIKAELIQEEQTVQPGRPFVIALRLAMDEGWHVYWKNPGDAGLPLKVEWKLPPGMQAGPLKWPFPEKFNLEDLVGFGYEKEVVLLAELSPAITLTPGSTLPLEAHITWLVCSSNTCQPGSATVKLTLQIDSKNPDLNEKAIALFKETRAKLPASHVSVKTIRKEGIVQLQVPAADSLQETLLGVDFFPEQTDVIDHSVDPTVAMNNDIADKNKYVVNLKGSDEIGVDHKTLKGVLVVRTQQAAGQHVQVYDIDSPIQEEADFLTMAEIPKKGLQPIPLLGAASAPTHASAQFEGGVALALLFAFVGGMILNLMPCVLPVMSFKVMSFVKMSGQSRSLTMKHGLMFSVGVVLSFWVLAGAMLLLRTYGHAVGWGFQLQEPLFVVLLASILFVFALSQFGVFELGMSVASWAGQTEVELNQQRSGYMSSFLSGILATAVATPCTGPFLGSAVGFAVTLPAFQALLIFTSLALGLCFPYLVLAAFPSFLRFIPRPGPWMETFKQLMGFGLLATVLWLLWVFSAQTNSLSLICILAGFLCFSIGAWVYGRGTAPLVSKRKRWLAYAVVAVMVVIGGQIMLMPRASWYQEDSSKTLAHDSDWEPFSLERIAELQKKGTPVLVDFTAKWCLICQANHLVLSSAEVEEHIAAAGIVKMKADWTKSDPAITQELSRFGRTSVPLYVLYGTNEEKETLILSQVLTPDIVIDHIKSAIDSELIVLNE